MGSLYVGIEESESFPFQRTIQLILRFPLLLALQTLSEKLLIMLIFITCLTILTKVTS